MKCLWCGTRGGVINQLIIYVASDGTAVYECEWCTHLIYERIWKEGNERG